MSELTVLVPTFNEAPNVDELVSRLSGQLAALDAEIMFVDDSTDDTPDVIADAATRAVTRGTTPVTLIHRTIAEGGLAGAVVSGLRAITSPWVVVMDGDLQHPPALVPALYLEGLHRHVDVVVASRYLDGGGADGLDNRFRELVSTSTGWTAKALFPRRLRDCSDPMSGFFALRVDAVDVQGLTQCGFKILLALLVHRPLRVVEMPFVFGTRVAGVSKTSFREGLRFVQLLASLKMRSIGRTAVPPEGGGPRGVGDADVLTAPAFDDDRLVPPPDLQAIELTSVNPT